MDKQAPETHFDRLFVRNMVESSVRIAVLFLLLYFSYDIIKPFIIPLIWGGIIAMASFPLVRWLQNKTGMKRGLAASLVCLVFILALVIPTFSLTSALISSAKGLTTQLEQGTLTIPPPSEKIAELP